MESWFIVSNLMSNDQRLSLQVHTGVVQAGSQRAASLNISITNLSTKWYKQYDYGISSMATNGTITIEDTKYPITDGTTWFNRQYGGMPATLADQNQMASTNWLWRNIVLDSGEVIVPFQCTQFGNKKMEIHCSVMYPEETHVLAKMKPIEASNRWGSPVTGHPYPTEFKIELPYNHSVLNVTVPFKEAEIISKVTGIKYEGTEKVKGIFDGKKVTGNTFVKLVGDWSE